MRKPVRSAPHRDDQGIWRVDSIKDIGSGGELQHEEIKIGELYYSVCEVLYTSSLYRCTCACNITTCREFDHRKSCKLVTVDYQSINDTGNQLSMCTCHINSIKLFWRYWRSILKGRARERLQLSGGTFRDEICGM